MTGAQTFEGSSPFSLSFFPPKSAFTWNLLLRLDFLETLDGKICFPELQKLALELKLPAK